MEIRIANNIDEWNNEIKDFNYSLYSTSEWVESLSSENRIPVYFDFTEKEITVAKIAGLLIEDSMFFRRKLFFHSGPSLRKNINKDIYTDCLDLLVSYAKIQKISRIVMLSYDFKYQITTNKTFRFDTRYEFVIDLSVSKDILTKEISHSVSRYYKRAIKNGYTVKESAKTDIVEPLVELLGETKKYRTHKGYNDYNPFYVPLFTKEAFINLITQKVIRTFVAYKDDKIIGMIAVLVKDDKAYSLLLGMTPEGYKEYICSFLEYHIILKLHEEGYYYLNLGGVSLDKTHAGLGNYKRTLGGKPFASTYGSTNFILFPYNTINPLMNLARVLPDNRMINFVRKLV